MIEGKKIVKVREMTQEEYAHEGWDNNRGFSPVTVIELEGGIRIWPSRDSEGNDGGVLFGSDEKGEFYVYPQKQFDNVKISIDVDSIGKRKNDKNNND